MAAAATPKSCSEVDLLRRPEAARVCADFLFLFLLSDILSAPSSHDLVALSGGSSHDGDDTSPPKWSARRVIFLTSGPATLAVLLQTQLLLFLFALPKSHKLHELCSLCIT